MKKYIIFAVLSVIAVISFSCYDDINSALSPNKPPKTYVSLYPDTLIAKQQSVLKLHWWGDDPDGLVIGFYYTMDGVNWKFTTQNDLEIVFPIAGTDTLYNFRVAAVDNKGNGKYDSKVVRTINGIDVDLGAEPLADTTSTSSYIDIGSVDPNPAKIELPITNSPPKLSYLLDPKGAKIEIPEFTYTVASFGWNAEDIDGDNSIQSIMVSLNDTTHWIELPGNTRFLTLIAKPPFVSNDTTSCSVYLGYNMTLYKDKLPNMKLNSNNVLYVVAKDIANTKSQRLTFPSAGGQWYVSKPSGKLLIIDDCAATNDKSAAVYAQMMDSIGFSTSSYDVLDIKRGATAQSPGVLVPKFVNPMLTETMKLFKAVFWYTDNTPTIDAARKTIKAYASEQGGGKLLLSMMFGNDVDSNVIADILPLDNLKTSKVNGYLPVSYSVPVRPTAQAVGYPMLASEDVDCPFGYIRGYFPSDISSSAIYKIEADAVPATIGVKSSDGRLIFMGFPIAYLNGPPSNLKAFFDKVIKQEFGVTP